MSRGCEIDLLHSYQREAIDFGLNRLYTKDLQGAGLFLDPGLGKTRITLEVLNTLRGLNEIERVLIVAPMRVCHSVWPQEIEKWGFDFTTNVMCRRVKASLKNDCFIDLINPESLHLLEYNCARWDTLVIDESTKFKSWRTKRMKCLRKMLPNFLRRIILTGTPAPNSLADLHSQAYILDDGAALGRNVTVFRARYMARGGWQGRQWQLRSEMTDSLNEAIAPMVLRMDAESNLEMPELLVNDMFCELPPKCVAGYRQLKRELLAQLETGDILAVNAASAYIKMRQFSNGQIYDADRNVHFVHSAKVDMLCDLIEELAGKPILVFYQFQHDADAISKKFPDAPVLSGKTKPGAVNDILNDWNVGRTHVLLAQNQTASHGLNMQGSGTDIAYFGIGDSLEVYEQSYRRIYRQGIRGSQVRIHRLLTRGTTCEVIRDRLHSKDQSQQAFFKALRAHAELN